MKHIYVPMRMCIVCRKMKPKLELIRLVKDNENGAAIDEKGKKEGRGAYVCKDILCVSNLKKSRKLEKTFARKIENEFYILLEKYLEKIYGQ